MTQKQQVIETMRDLGGFATFNRLNSAIDFSTWGTKSPEASIRRIVQTNSEFFKIKPGLWGLEDHKNSIREKLKISIEPSKANNAEERDHTYYQGFVVEIGNVRKWETYIPSQDKNRLYLQTPLHEIATLKSIPEFTYPSILASAKTIDVIWFNRGKCPYPYAFFEIEHSTDFKNSLLKFCDLQIFRAKFYIVAEKHRHEQFDSQLERPCFSMLANRVEFIGYDEIESLNKASKILRDCNL